MSSIQEQSPLRLAVSRASAEGSAQGKETAGVIPRDILVVDDEPSLRKMLIRCMSRLGHHCVEAETAPEALKLAACAKFDVVLSDFRMPGMCGIELLKKLKEMDVDLPVIIISGNQEITDAVRAMKLGADDYIQKPIIPDTVQVSIDRALKNRELKLEIRAYQGKLEKMVAERTSQVQRLFMNVIQSLIHTLEAKDPYTNGHSKRVAWLSYKLGQAAALSTDDLQVVQLAAVLHDLGKIGIRESVLQKNGVLTFEEYEHIREHVLLGVRILEPLKELRPIIPLIRHHHERYDGEGYPDRLQGENIPLGARIIAVADAFDAMMCARPYRAAISSEDTLNRLRFGSGTQFDPDLIQTFLPLTEDRAMKDALVSPHWTSTQLGQLVLPATDYASLVLSERAV